MATLTLRNVPDELVARIKARAKRHRRSLNNETIAALELDATLTAATPPLAAATMAPDWETALARVREIQARFPGAVNAAHQPREPQELQEELDLFARLRTQFKGPPLTSAAIIAAIDRDSHPPEPPSLAAAGKVSH
jgi:plasmid stability protein